jgi:protein-tyrosine phosphatase
MEHLVARAGLDERVTVESAATEAWHVGEPPDPRVCEVARRLGITLHGSARHFTAHDFARFDHVVAVDRQCVNHLRRLGDYDQDQKIVLLRRFQPGVVDAPDLADPLYGDDSDVTVMFDHCESACAGLLGYLRTLHGL